MESSCNDITGDPVRTGRKGSLEKYATGWELIFSKGKDVQLICDDCNLDRLKEDCPKPEDCGMMGEAQVSEIEKKDWNESCAGWNSCYHCDNGWFPCNQYCIVMGE